jgi:predicted DNA-binding protein
MLVLNPTLEHRLNATAQALKRPVQDLLDEAVAAYLQDLQDTRVAEEICRQIEAGEETTTPWSEVEKRLGLAS